jgi:hypothetical protein
MNLTTSVKTLLASVSNLYTGSMPDSPDNAVCIYLTGGYDADVSGTKVEEPTFVVRVRNTSYETGETLCNTIIGLLHGSSTANILGIYSQGAIQDLGRDESNRQQWTMNFRAYFRK